MKYFVIATYWDNDRKIQVVKYIAGEFNNYVNARLFQKAYNDHYHANAVIIEDFQLINH